MPLAHILGPILTFYHAEVSNRLPQTVLHQNMVETRLLHYPPELLPSLPSLTFGVIMQKNKIIQNILTGGTYNRSKGTLFQASHQNATQK